MKSFWVFLLLAVPLLVLAEEKQKQKIAQAAPPAPAGPGKLTDSVASPTTVTEYKKTVIRKPKRSNGEIPLLIIRPVEKRRKVYFKEPTVKIASGGVATYGTYPELHTSDGEMFTLEHMLPILSLEGMLKGFPKHGAPVAHNHFVPSPQFKPSDIHHLLAPQKTKEEYHHHLATGSDKTPALKPSQLLSVSHRPSEAIPAQALPSPPPPNYVPAVNSEVQLLKLGQPQHTSFYSLVSPQDKPAFVKPEQLPASFNFKVQQQEEQGHYKVNAIPLSKPLEHHHQPAHHSHFSSGGGATSYVGSQVGESAKFSKPAAQPAPFHHHGGAEHSGGGKWHELVPKTKLPQVSVSTNYYHPQTINAEQEHQQKQQQQPPTVQTHLSYYFPKEESVPAAHQVQHSPAAPHGHQATSYSNVQSGGGTGEPQIEFVVQKAPSGPAESTGAEKPLHKTYSSHIKQKYQKQHHHHHHHNQQPHVFIQKYFEFPSGSKAHQKTVVTEYHGTGHNDTAGGDHGHALPEPQAYAAPQYLPLPQPQALHQPQQHAAPNGPGPTAQTLHQAAGQPHHGPQYHGGQQHHHYGNHHLSHNSLQQQQHHHQHHHPQGAHSYWKFGRRNQDVVKPVVEHVHEQEPLQPDSQHAASGAVVRQVKHTTVLATSAATTVAPASSTKDAKDAPQAAQDRIDESQSAGNATAGASTAPTRTPKQIQNGCERRCIRNTVAQAYEPVCGTDGVTYSNRGKLRCARTCGNDDLEIQSYGECKAPGRA